MTADLQLEELLTRFDQAWQAEPPPRLEAFFPPGACNRPPRQFLEELVKIDLGYRWRGKAGPTPQQGTAGFPARPLLEDYAARYSALGALEEASVELIGEEYWVRHRWGDHPGHEEYRRRFVRQGHALKAALCRLDAELKRELDATRGPSREQPAEAATPVGIPMAQPVSPLSSATHLIALLKQFSLVTTAQWQELERADSLTEFAGPRELARVLLQREWLTPYQVNQVLAGHGQDLFIGPYVLLGRLGEGGTGQVFKARHQQMRRLVALKLIRRELVSDPEVVARFQREIQVASQLSHPNVVHAYDADVIGTTYFLAMEYVEGTDLGRLVKESGPLPWQQACDFIRQAALGLRHAHERGLVHRDVKPYNLLLAHGDLNGRGAQTEGGPWGLIKLLDLGLARLRGSSAAAAAEPLGEGHTFGRLTPAGAAMMGTPDYLAPEQALNFHDADARADIYGLGCTLYYLLAGEPPFAGGTLAERLLKHQQTEPPAPEQRVPGLPAGVGAVIRRMLAKRPEDRFQTAAEVATALATVLETGGWSGESSQPVANPQALPTSRPPRRARPTTRMLAVGLAVAVVAIFIGFLFRRSSAPPPSAGDAKRGPSARQPLIDRPILFNTPEADAVCSGLHVFPPDNPWNQAIENWPLHPSSKNIIASMGPDKSLRYNSDVSFVLVPPGQKKINVKSNWADESDGGPYPVPDNLPIEGWPIGYKGLSLKDVQQQVDKGATRRAVVVDPVNRLLYEFFNMRKTSTGWECDQASIFDLGSNKMRPEGRPSTDVAGLPVFPAVVRHDELRRGMVNHPMRVSASRTQRAYVYPARHCSSPHTNAEYPRMGERIRLRKDFDVSRFSPEVQAILKGLKKYGMFIADNGLDWAISVAPDPRIKEMHEELRQIKGADFEVVTPPSGYQQPR